MKLLTVADTAEILGVAPHTLAVWRSTGRYDLPYVKTGRLVRYRLADLEAFIERRRQTHTGMSSGPTVTR